MSAELGIWIDRMSPEQAQAMLGDDLLRLDLLRIPQHESRDTALAWAEEAFTARRDVPHRDVTTFTSAVAAGPPWGDRALAFLRDVPSAARVAAEGYLGWAVPGAEETGPAKFPDDLDTFERRVERANAALPQLSPWLAAGLVSGGLRALDTFPDAAAHASRRERLLRDIALLIWHARRKAAPAPRFDERGDVRPEAFRVLTDAASGDDLRALELGVRTAFRRAPNEYASVFEHVVRRAGGDPAGRAMEVAREAAATSGIRQVAVRAFEWAAASNSPLLPDAASLAGTLAPDDASTRERLERLARDHAQRAAAGEAQEGAAWFSAPSWKAFIADVVGRIDDATAAAKASTKERDELASRNRELETALTQLRQSLTEARTEVGATGRDAARRVASNVLKPVALAVADSQEAKSLEALQDRLLTVLRRAGIQPIGNVGDEQEFNPGVHTWVGEGQPPDRVQLISPGFTALGEEVDVVTLVPARVVAPR